MSRGNARRWILACAAAAALVGWGAVSLGQTTAAEIDAAIASLRAPDEDDRVAGAELIGRRGHRLRDRVGPPLRELLRSDPSPNVRAAAGRAIGRLGYRPAVPDLVRGLRDSSVDVRVVCAVALWRLPDPAAVPALVEATRDSDAVVREWAALALGVVRDRSATQAVQALLQDDTRAVRLAAIRALGRIGEPTVLPVLRGYLSRRGVSVEERLEGVAAIAQVRGPERLDVLAAMLADSDAGVRIAVAGALGQSGDALAIPALRRHARDREIGVRNAVAQAIREIQARVATGADGGVRDGG
ncbi:MAG: HEAT repeat domain-containing protein [Deltaproteobacteria bacterium]|nr:HEAT repeat domain-containing protein [Deltaproteobacteria bacterium]